MLVASSRSVGREADDLGGPIDHRPVAGEDLEGGLRREADTDLLEDPERSALERVELLVVEKPEPASVIVAVKGLRLSGCADSFLAEAEGAIVPMELLVDVFKNTTLWN